jgi:coenzyme F420-0:L-glutamate ligase/coenzyme F420-1:gamma-L-glutamate ligase
MTSVSVLAMHGLPEIQPGDDLVPLLLACRPEMIPGDVLVVTQKVVSKAEGRLVRLDQVRPSRRALEIAQSMDKDPALVELVLQESEELVRQERGVLVSRTHHGFVCANAGIDLSNVDGGHTACLLPKDPDGSARQLYQRLRETLGFPVPVLISDSFGRPWRQGITNVTLGCCGLEPLLDYRGQTDAQGLEMKATVTAVADSLAAATELVVGKSTGAGACIVRGYAYVASEQADFASTIRPWDQCFFQ